MAVQLYDETVRKPSWRYWLLLFGLSGVSSLGFLDAEHYLFPSETTSVAMIEDIAPKSTNPLTVSAETPPVKEAPTVSSSALLTPTEDPVRGFQLSRPSAWSVWSADGVILGQSDSCGTTSVLFYPTQLTAKTVTAKTYLEDVTNVILSQLGSSGKLSLGRVDASREGTATALLAGTVCNNAVEGNVTATIQGSQALFKLAWFPTSQKAQLTNTVNSILQSYKMTQAQILPYQGTTFGLAVPSGWTVTETDQSVMAASGKQTVSAMVVDFSASSSLETSFDSWLNVQHTNGNTLSDWSLDADSSLSLDDASGRHWNGKTEYVHYTKDGATYRGALTASYTDTLGNSAWMLWRTSPDAKWSSSTSALTAIEQSATILSASGRLPTGVATLSLPTIQTAADDQLLKGVAFRSALNSAASGRWQSKIDSFRPLTDPSGAWFFATLNAQSLLSGAFLTTVNGKAVTLTPEASTK